MSGKIILTLITVSLLIVGCADKTIVTNYDSGEKMEEYQYAGDSLKNGWYKRFSKGGILLEEALYVEGRLDGKRKVFSSEGQLEVEEIYKLDKLEGELKTYYPNGKVKLAAIYTDNVMGGIVKGYYESGALKEEVTFVDNIENGPFKEFHENGKPKWEGNYRDGSNEFGLLQKYNEAGELIRKMMCDDRAICTTTWTIDGSHLTENK